MDNLTDIINQLESLKCHVEDMLDSEDSIWQKDAEALTVAIDVTKKLNDGYKLCRINEALEVLGQIAWKNHSKYGKDLIDISEVVNIIREACDE